MGASGMANTINFSVWTVEKFLIF